ncbi:MAG: hypothetical protein CMJ58_20530 [Planctomycetaceae bacterium]|nr:hypothetical protein [Planctomycetaceae bacterium]
MVATSSLVVIDALAPACHAHGGGGDVAVFENNGKVDIGFAIPNDDDTQRLFFDPTDKVFQTILIPAPPIPGAPDVGSTEPGYDSLATSKLLPGQLGDLPPGESVSYNVLDTWFWDGAALVPASGVEAGMPDVSLPISADGSFHNHPLYGLHDLTDDGNPIPDGVYVGKLSVSVTGLGESPPLYMVSLVDNALLADADPQGAAEALGEAVRNYMDDPTGNPVPMYGGRSFAFYAEATRFTEALAAVPEPTTALLALAGLIGLVGYKRM